MRVKDLVTENDNETGCIARVSWASSFIALCGLVGLTVMSGGAVGIVEFSIALATIAAGHGAAIKLKS